MDPQTISAQAARASAHAATLSAFAAYAAAGAAGLIALIQAYVGHRQSKAALISAQAALKNAENAGRHRIAGFRQEWINRVMDALCDHHAIVMTDAGTPEDSRRLATLKSKLEILLNPNEPDTVDLLIAMDEVPLTQDAAREAASDRMIAIARRLLKKEWARIKDELS